MMNELLKKIYEEVICYEEDMMAAGKQVETEINKLIEPYTDQMNESTLETVKTLLYQTSFSAEQTGFWLGVKYTIKLLSEILSK